MTVLRALDFPFFLEVKLRSILIKAHRGTSTQSRLIDHVQTSGLSEAGAWRPPTPWAPVITLAVGAEGPFKGTAGSHRDKDSWGSCLPGLAARGYEPTVL